MEKILNIIAAVFLLVIAALVLGLFALGWVQRSYAPLIPCCLILLVLIILAALYIRRIQLDYDELESDYKELESKYSDCKDREKYSKEKCQNLESELEAFRSSRQDGVCNANAPQNASDADSESPMTEETPNENPQQPDTISVEQEIAEYYSSPNCNGEFDRSHAKKQNNDECFYKITSNPKDPQGKLELLDKGDYSRLLGGYKTDCLYPVCEVLEGKTDGSHIHMVESGYVILQGEKGEKWNVNNGKKIKIKIE